MEEQKDIFALLDMMIQPVFCVKENTIIRVNAAARQLLLAEGDSILPLLQENAEEYAAFSGGCLYLSLNIAGQRCGATVRQMNGTDVFELDVSGDNGALRAMALAAAALRKPLSGALAETASLLDTQEDPDTLQQLSLLNRNLFQILRLLGNMSDAEYVSAHCQMETLDVASVFREIFEKAQTLTEKAGIHLSYDGLDEPVYCLADQALLERAVLNILSNAAKFTPKGGRITVSLTRRGQMLRLSFQDSGSGIAQDVMGSLFQRYLRQPGIEDSRFGLGLGIRMVHSAAAHHGGTLLITQSDDGGTRVVLSIAVRQKAPGQLSSPIFRIDYTGGFDHTLVEFSESLPAELFDGSY